MAVALSDLLVEPTEESVLAFALENLDALGFGATSWQPGSWGLTILRFVARMTADVGKAIPVTARSGFIRLAEGDWKTLVAKEVYGVDRELATVTVGKFVLTSTAGAPSHTINVGDLQIATAASGDAITYRNTSGGTLNPGSTLTIDVVAEVAGADANIASGTTLYLWTPLVGVTATNPAIAPTTTWITTPGTDEESDDRLQVRALGQWDTLGYGVGESGYNVWALEADSSVTRVLVRLGSAEGEVEVICATAVGGISGAQVTAISDYIHGSDGIGRRPINDVVTVMSATEDVLNVPWTVTVDADFVDVTTSAVVQAALDAYAAALPIGGLIIPPATTGIAVAAEAVAVVMGLPGVLNVSGVGGDYSYLSPVHVLVPTYTVTMVYV